MTDFNFTFEYKHGGQEHEVEVGVTLSCGPALDLDFKFIDRPTDFLQKGKFEIYEQDEVYSASLELQGRSQEFYTKPIITLSFNQGFYERHHIRDGQREDFSFNRAKKIWVPLSQGLLDREEVPEVTLEQIALINQKNER